MKEEVVPEELLAEIQRLRIQNQRMAERIAYLERLLWGGKRDKRVAQGPTLFDAFFNEAADAREAAIAETVQEIRKEAEKRRACGRKKAVRPERYLYTGLPEEWRTEYPKDINLSEYDIIGKDVERILHRTPARVWVECVERPVLRKKGEKDIPSPHILQAPAPVPVLGGGHVAADFLAGVLTDKFVYHIPEYRQVKMYADAGVKLSTSTLNDWVHRTAGKLYPLYETLIDDILQSDYLQVDEVPWRIADRPGQSCRHGYAWQFRDARPQSRGTYFYYLKGSRSGEIPRAQLRHFRGAVQTDGYKVYDYFESVPGIVLLACMAHIRRKFIEAQKSHPGEAAKALEYIAILYTLEENLRSRGASEEEIRAQRRGKALPVLDAMEAWMESVQHRCTPDDLLGKALDYAYKLWPRVRRYTDDGRYLLDNNPVERGQRPTVMGRKNYLFSKTDEGAVDNAVIYSLLGSCEIVRVNPLKWLEYALANLNTDCTEEELAKLLPCNFT